MAGAEEASCFSLQNAHKCTFIPPHVKPSVALITTIYQNSLVSKASSLVKCTSSRLSSSTCRVTPTTSSSTCSVTPSTDAFDFSSSASSSSFLVPLFPSRAPPPSVSPLPPPLPPCPSPVAARAVANAGEFVVGREDVEGRDAGV
eukprot:CAMPEP_0179426370 /NCGR_PEP_ID=MMETSP0799-20121207/12697_1 /TAXON_ID=46947 /ORGANISM="Geminigera cryophila, Strain CCMP2564" /LENGTH=144 /DNA_ID=CAMNT_0021201107 /DNA_START=390 /DNA_END=824 /DNA_ORIENTATION=-